MINAEIARIDGLEKELSLKATTDQIFIDDYTSDQ